MHHVLTYIISLIIFFIPILSTKKYSYYNYTQIFSIFKNLSSSCSHYIKIDTSQNRYNLDTIKDCGVNIQCKNLIVFLTDFDSYTLDRPAYYISGELHGDERLGPTLVTEFAKYFCDTYNENKNSLNHNLLKNKLIIITPMTNAFGYYHGKREEKIEINKDIYDYEDPNRDFPYFNSNKDNHNCMRTIAGRTINEIFNEFIIESGITFHGGTSVIGYAWGNYIHLKKNNNRNIFTSTESPDYNAFNNIGKIMLKSSSSPININSGIRDYILGDMSSTVYPLDGAFEDWAYGGWENEINEKLGIIQRPIKGCKPDSFNKYNMNWKNPYGNDYKLRCLMFLVETADEKNPDIELNDLNELNNDIFDFHNKNFSGHISRNLRLIYSGVDLISSSIFLDTKKIQKIIYDNSIEIRIPFLFMGCLNLKKYIIYKFKIDDINREIFERKYFEENLNSFTKVTEEENDINCYYSNLTLYNITINLTNANNTLENKKSNLSKKLMSSEDESNNKYTIYFIRAEGPDQNWKFQTNPDPNVEPQSHVVRSKINSSYFVQNGNYSLKSNYYFYSYPIIVFNYREIQIIDDIDSLFYEKCKSCIKLIINLIEKNYKINSKVFIDKKYKNEKYYLNHYLTSENIFEINLEFNIQPEKDNFKDIFNDKAKIDLISEILLSDENDIFHLNQINCEAKMEKYNNIIIKCNNILSKYNIDGRFIRQKLSNSLIKFELILNKEININFFGQFTLDDDMKGKYYIDYYSKENFTNDNNNMICTSNFPFFIYQLKEKNNNYYNNIDEIYYEIIINKMSTKNLRLNINIFQSRSAYNFNFFIIIFPFYTKLELYDIRHQINIDINLEESANGKIIGKTIYIIPIDESDIENVLRISDKMNSNNNIFDSLSQILKNKYYKYIPCSIMSFNSFKNEYSLSQLVNFSDIFTIKNRYFYLSNTQIIIISILLFIIIIVSFVIIRKKYFSFYSSYHKINSISTSNKKEIQINKVF